ncbi:hypothetical protein AKAW_11248 [Aspergillus luchuensis IFO 4308]|nr:hypothetical protein AKAW_11248 [Aspergillus luchuensis IFO 4308]
MAKRHHRAWTPGEEQDNPSWVARHLHLMWPERARKYSIERKPRTKESLRTKYRLLEKDVRRHRRPMCKTPSRLRHRIPRRLGRGQHRTWPSPVSISAPTPSEHRSDDSGPLRMREMRPPAPTRVARDTQNHGQAARSTQGPKSTVQSPAKCAHRRGFETLWVRKGPRDHPGKSMPRATGQAVRYINDLLWCRGRKNQWDAVTVVECTLQNRSVVAFNIPRLRSHEAVTQVESRHAAAN